MGVMLAMIMRPPLEMPAQPIPAMVRYKMSTNHVSVGLDEGRLTPTISIADDVAAAQRTEPISKINRAARKVHFRLKKRKVLPKGS
jgi:hypothetical protein